MFGGPDKWLKSDPHYTLVLGPGDHVEVKNEVSTDRIITLLHVSMLGDSQKFSLFSRGLLLISTGR